MDIEVTTDEKLRREDAARRLHAVADELARNNQLTLVRDGKRVSVNVPDDVRFSLEYEVGDGNEIEIELGW